MSKDQDTRVGFEFDSCARREWRPHGRPNRSRSPRVVQGRARTTLGRENGSCRRKSVTANGEQTFELAHRMAKTVTLVFLLRTFIRTGRLTVRWSGASFVSLFVKRGSQSLPQNSLLLAPSFNKRCTCEKPRRGLFLVACHYSAKILVPGDVCSIENTTPPSSHSRRNAPANPSILRSVQWNAPKAAQ